MNKVIKKAFACAYTIIILIVPFSLLCDLLSYFGVINNIAFLFGPIGKSLLLPPDIVIALASGFFFNLYAGIAVASTLDLTPSQWTIFGIFLATCHSIPIEGVVLKKVGMPFTFHCLARLFCGFGSAWIFAHFLSIDKKVFPTLSVPNQGKELALNIDSRFFDFLIKSLQNSIQLSVKIIVLVVGLILLFELLKNIKKVDIFLRKNSYISSLIVGSLLGITYGAGILLKDIKEVDRFQKILLLIFLMLAHGLIEETLLFSFFGASPFPILFFRVGVGLFAVILTYFILRNTHLLSLVKR